MIAALQTKCGDQNSLHTVRDVRHALLYADDGETMLAVMWERPDGTTALTRAGEPDFERLCDDMGLHKRLHVRCVQARCE